MNRFALFSIQNFTTWNLGVAIHELFPANIAGHLLGWYCYNVTLYYLANSSEKNLNTLRRAMLECAFPQGLILCCFTQCSQLNSTEEKFHTILPLHAHFIGCNIPWILNLVVVSCKNLHYKIPIEDSCICLSSSLSFANKIFFFNYSCVCH